MVNASLTNTATTGKCVGTSDVGQDPLSDNGLSQQFSTAGLPK